MTELTKTEYKLLDACLKEAGWSRQGCRVRWEPKTTFGVYRPLPEWIGISGALKGMVREVAPCVVHELVHRAQRHRVGLLPYYILLHPLRWRWEREAKRAEDEAMRALDLHF
jgi:hypothetical protein